MENNTKTKWAIDFSHSEVGFTVRHMMISNVKGIFKSFDGNIETFGNDFTTAEVVFKMDASSVYTKDDARDGHLKSADFFDVEKHKEITFKSKALSQSSDGSLILIGDLSIKAISKEIKLNVDFGGILKDPWGNEKAGFTIYGKINRKDWDLNWNVALEAGGILVGDDVKINIDLELTKSA